MTMFPSVALAPASPPPPFEALPPVDAHFQSRARREGELYDEIALEHLVAAGAAVEVGRHKIEHYPLDARIVAANGGRYLVAAHVVELAARGRGSETSGLGRQLGPARCALHPGEAGAGQLTPDDLAVVAE